MQWAQNTGLFSHACISHTCLQVLNIYLTKSKDGIANALVYRISRYHPNNGAALSLEKAWKGKQPTQEFSLLGARNRQWPV